jgi:hypothetical protein
LDILLKIQTIKSSINIELSSNDVKNQYNILLDVIRDMEFDSKNDSTAAKIEVLDSILDILGNMLLVADEEH